MFWAPQKRTKNCVAGGGAKAQISRDCEVGKIKGGRAGSINKEVQGWEISVREGKDFSKSKINGCITINSKALRRYS